MPRPTTRAVHDLTKIDTEHIKFTLDPIQVTFNTLTSRLCDWRTALHTRYVGDLKPQKITSVWKDLTNDKKTYLKLPISLTSLPVNLHNTFPQINYNYKKLLDFLDLTINIYYTTGTILIQGLTCKTWISNEFEKLKNQTQTLTDVCFITFSFETLYCENEPFVIEIIKYA